MKTQIKTEFKDGKIILTHPSGHVDEYDKEHLMKIKEYSIKRREEIDKRIKLIETDISKL